MPTQRPNAAHAGNLAAIALAGIRPILTDTITPTNGSADDPYTVQSAATNRVMLFHLASNDDDVRVCEVGGTAVATDMPVASGVYFVMEAYEDDVISLYNGSGGALTIYVMELL